MVATADCPEKPKAASGSKVSKPLMEKKRRARINKCLEQLKGLLESYYSSSIRKRKLEKADILELTVKHLRTLQKSHSRAASDHIDFQAGFRSCLATVSRYLQLSEPLYPEEASGGVDSGPGAPRGLLLAPGALQRRDTAATAGGHTGARRGHTGTTRDHSLAPQRANIPAQTEKSAEQRKHRQAQCARAADMWRPW